VRESQGAVGRAWEVVYRLGVRARGVNKVLKFFRRVARDDDVQTREKQGKFLFNQVRPEVRMRKELTRRPFMMPNLAEQLRALEARVIALEARQEPILVPITTLEPEPFELLKEIKVVVEPSDEEYVASFIEANVNASGCTAADSINNLKDVLLGKFDFLDRLPPDKLGPGPAKDIAVLRTFLRRRT
jgi:hypothetical protein